MTHAFSAYAHVSYDARTKTEVALCGERVPKAPNTAYPMCEDCAAVLKDDDETEAALIREGVIDVHGHIL